VHVYLVSNYILYQSSLSLLSTNKQCTYSINRHGELAVSPKVLSAFIYERRDPASDLTTGRRSGGLCTHLDTVVSAVQEHFNDFNTISSYDQNDINQCGET
jgi:hypothetical protein